MAVGHKIREKQYFLQAAGVYGILYGAELEREPMGTEA